MSLGVLVGREPPSNSVSAAAGRKDAKAADGKSSDFKDFMHSHGHGADKTKADKAVDGDGESGKKTDGDQPAWRGLGLHFGPVTTAEETGGEKAGDDGTDEPDATAVGAMAAAGIVLPAATPAGKGGEEAAMTAPPVAPGDEAKIAPDAEAIVETSQIAMTANAAAQPGLAKSEAKQPGLLANPARASSGENIQNSAPPAAVKAALQANASSSDAQSGGGGNGREQQGQAAMPAPGGGRTAGVTVISQQVTPAPVAAVQSAPISDTGTALVNELAPRVPRGEQAEAAANATMAQQAGKLTPITTLRIQLHPAELGLVTAKLSGTHAQLSIEISVGNAEARHRLTSDSDSIVSALKGMGINVDRVTVQHTQAGSGATPDNGGRGGEFAQSGDSRGEGQGKSARQGSERHDGENPQSARRAEKAEMAGGGVYI